jgi:hypothetical protein
MKFLKRKKKESAIAGEPHQFFLEGTDIGTPIAPPVVDNAVVMFTEIPDVGWAWTISGQDANSEQMDILSMSGVSETYQLANHESRQALRSMGKTLGFKSRRVGLVFDVTWK